MIPVVGIPMSPSFPAAQPPLNLTLMPNCRWLAHILAAPCNFFRTWFNSPASSPPMSGPRKGPHYWQNGAASALMRGLYRTILMNRELSWKSKHLLVNLCSNTHLWSQSLASDQKTEIAHTSGQNEFPP